MSAAPVANLFSAVERLLSTFYGFPLTAHAFEYLLKDTPTPHRAAVLFHYNEEEEVLDIGLGVASDILSKLSQDNPAHRLHDGNLDAFFVLIEELSHFHLLINRAQLKQPISQLELEWQGEIDKILVSAIFLFEQQKDPHWASLLHRLFSETTVIDLNKIRYEEASRFAARFWYDLIQSGICEQKDPFLTDHLRQILRKKYWETWQAKVSQYDRRRLVKSS